MPNVDTLCDVWRDKLHKKLAYTRLDEDADGTLTVWLNKPAHGHFKALTVTAELAGYLVAGFGTTVGVGHFAKLIKDKRHE